MYAVVKEMSGYSRMSFGTFINMNERVLSRPIFPFIFSKSLLSVTSMPRLKSTQEHTSGTVPDEQA
jgi:hypothetical protein